METTEWITIDQASREYEVSHAELCIEVRIFADYEQLIAEPLYYKLVGRGGKILMDGSYASREADRLWSYIEHIVDQEYTPSHLEWMATNDESFEKLRDLQNMQARMDREWYRAQVI